MVLKIIKDHLTQKFINFKYYMSENYGNYLDKDFLFLKFKLLYLITRDFIKDSIKWINKNKGLSIFIVSSILSVFTGEYDKYALWGSILFILTLLSNIFNFYKEKNNVDNIDLEFYVKNINSKVDILDNYIEKCFDNVLILTRGYLENPVYIRTKEEEQLRKDLLDEVAKNLSPILIKKLKLYYGDSIYDIITEKVYIRVTMYVANCNKNIYSPDSRESSSSKIIQSLLKQ